MAISRGVSVLLSNGNGTFQPHVDYTTGGGSGVAVGDFNADGKTDLAVATGIETVSTLFGNGDGTFEAPAGHVAGSIHPYGRPSVAVGDFNGDQKADLVVSDAKHPTVTILLNNGNGRFQAAASYETGNGPGAVAIADFNGDGKPDLAVANGRSTQGPADNTVSVLLGKGDGTFRAHVDYLTGITPVSIAGRALFLSIGDFNGDGKPDLAVANDSEEASYHQAVTGETPVPRGMAVPAMTAKFDHFVNFVAT